MREFGFVRVAAAAPLVRIGDCRTNAGRVVAVLSRAADEGVDVAVFPELCLTGYTCADLFQQRPLLRAAEDGLAEVRAATATGFPGVVVVGLPVAADDHLFNCAAVLHRGRILGLVPKLHLPIYKEFYERRWFAAGTARRSRDVRLAGETVWFGTDQLFEADDVPGLRIGVEICEDLWMPVPPSCLQALDGAVLLVNLSASNALVGKADYRRQLVLNQSARCLAGYVYASCGAGESSTDLVFDGHCLIAENGELSAESDRFCRDDTLIVADLDVERLQGERLRQNGFGESRRFLGPTATPFVVRRFTLGRPGEVDGGPRGTLRRVVDRHPFVPRGADALAGRCREVFQIQVAGLARRLEHLAGGGRIPPIAIGVSGGLDSTLSLLVACKTMDALGLPRTEVRGFSLPGFGTSTRTRRNSLALMKHLGVTSAVTDIRGLCLEEMRLLGHRPFGLDVTGLGPDEVTAALQPLPADRRNDLVFENVQARVRTNLLMNSGFVLGTGDLSELALGWCTYNADHMSMYNPNGGVPKTLVAFLVRWAAEHEFEGEGRAILRDVADTEISPELLPTTGDGGIAQSTEQIIGPYELHDFFLYHVVRHGFSREKILFLADRAFAGAYPPDELRRWLTEFLARFFANQYKRSCLPDGPKVGSVSLSPRGDWRMPSDATATTWLR